MEHSHNENETESMDSNAEACSTLLSQPPLDHQESIQMGSQPGSDIATGSDTGGDSA